MGLISNIALAFLLLWNLKIMPLNQDPFGEEKNER
jgi:hypothetical protein